MVFVRCLIVGYGLTLAAGAAAQTTQAGTGTWPSRNVTMVLGYAAGSPMDNVARFLADGLRERTGQPFVIENKPGAVGNIGARAVARAAPDGYTVLFTPNSTHGINPHLFKDLGFDPVKDFQPVTTLLSQGFVLVVNPKLPVHSVAELTAYIKARPGKLAYAHGNAAGRVASEWYLQLAGLEVMNVPYKVVEQGLREMLSGATDFMFTQATLGIPSARSGRVRALAVTNTKRLEIAPDIPTMSESGLGNYVVESWFALFFPSGVPIETARRLADLTNAVMTSDKARGFLRNLAAAPFPGSPESLAKVVAAEIAKWGPVIRAAGIKPE